MSTLERALEETRLDANAHRGFGVLASGQCETGDDPMDLTVQMPVVRRAASARPGSRVSFWEKCFNCGRMGHMRDTCPVPRRAQLPLPAGGYGLHTPCECWTNTGSFRPGNVGRQCFVWGALCHLAKDCPSRAGGPGARPQQRQSRPQGRASMFHQEMDPKPGSVMYASLDTVEEEGNEALGFPFPVVIAGGDLLSPLGSSLRGDSGRCFATTSPRSQAMGFSNLSPPLHISWADKVPDAGLASPDPGPAEQVLAISPMRHVQISIGKVTMPALVDSGAGSNFIEQGVADTLKLKLFP